MNRILPLALFCVFALSACDVNTDPPRAVVIVDAEAAVLSGSGETGGAVSPGVLTGEPAPAAPDSANEPAAAPTPPAEEPSQTAAEPPPPDGADGANGTDSTDGAQTGFPVPTPWPDDGVNSPYPSSFANSALSDDSMSWYYMRSGDHQPPTAQRVFDIREYGAYYLGDITQKVVYLTFDEGYEYGFTPGILDTLREKGVHAAFFMTRSFIRDNPDLARRIAEEGHIAANHSVTHREFPELTDDEIIYELTETARYFEEITGYAMPPYFRPPSGVYSERTLAVTQALGYKTVFWSFAHVDWLRDDQPGAAVAYQRVMDSLHNGEIMLLHAVSESNAEALPDIIDAVRALGYTFGSLNDI